MAQAQTRETGLHYVVETHDGNNHAHFVSLSTAFATLRMQEYDAFRFGEGMRDAYSGWPKED